MKLVVAGSSGFIGTHLVAHLAAQGHEVVGFDVNTPQEGAQGLSAFVQGDIRSAADVRRALGTGTDGLINLAAKHHDSGITRDEYYSTNVDGTACLLQGLTDAGIQRYVFYSSIAVYGDQLAEMMCTEQTAPLPTSLYGITKYDAEKLVDAWAQADPARRATIVRPCVVIGPGNFANTMNLIKQIESGFFVRVGDGTAVKSMCYVENLAHATTFLMDRAAPGLTVHNYVDMPGINVDRVVNIIAEELGKRPPRFRVDLELLAQLGRVFDVAAKVTGKALPVSSARIRKLGTPSLASAQKLLDEGFRPPQTLETGLRAMVRWFVAHFRGNPNPPAPKPY